MKITKLFTFLLFVLLTAEGWVKTALATSHTGGGGTPTPPGGGGTPAPPGGGGAPITPGGGSSGPGLQNPLQADSIIELFRAIIEIIMVFAIPIIVFFIVWAGFLYVTARGSVEKIQTAHRALLYALIGALLIIGANVLIQVVSGTVQSVTG